MTRDIKEWFADWLQSILALNVLSFRHRPEGLPKSIYDIPDVDVYEANGSQGDDWEPYLKAQGQAWICTPLHYTKSGLRNIRKASGGGTWHEKEKIYEDADCCVREYIFKVKSKKKQQATNERMRLRKYTMIEYTRNEDKPMYALCRISVVNKKNATSQQGEGKEIDHTDSNNGDKHKTSLSHESMQEGGNFQNTRADFNQQILKSNLHELRKHHSYADTWKLIFQALDQVETEILSAASPKEESTEAPVSKMTHGRCTYMNTTEAGTSTKWQGKAKVEMFESKTYQEKPTNLRCDTNRNCLQKNDEEDRIYWEQLLSSCNTDGCFKWDDIRSDKNCMQLDSELAELIANGQEHNQLSHNFNANSTVAMDYQNRIEPYPSTSNFATTEGRLDHQMVEPNAHFQDPKLYHNINGNSTEQVLNNNHLPSWNGNISAAFMGGLDEQEFEQNVQDPYNFNANLTEPTENGWYLPFYYAPTVPPITDQGTYNAIEEQQFPLCNTQHWQMFESDANVLDPTENGNHLPIYNQNTIAPGLDENNNATAEPEDMDWRNYPDLSATIDWNRV